MDGNKVDCVLTVWVGEDAGKVRDEGRRSPNIGTKEETSLVVIIGVQVVPDEWLALQHI